MSKFRPSPLPARLHGAGRALREQADSAFTASKAGDEMRGAMLRGKAKAYREAAKLIDALITGGRSSKLRKSPSTVEATRPVLVSRPVSHIVTFWAVGSRESTWADEYAELMDPANQVTQGVAKRVDAEGIDFADDYAPVLLGSDGRVWDGHHRICIAIERGIPSLMCELAGESS